MMPLLVFRERVKNFYQRNDIYITPVIKFIFAFISIQIINSEFGYQKKIAALPIVLALSLLSAFLPSAIMVLIAAVVAILNVYFVSPVLSIIILLALLILYFLFIRFTPSLGYVILAIPILYVLRIPYMIPVLLGLISSPIAVIPTGCGVIVYFLFQIIKAAIGMQVNMTVEDTLKIYTFVIDSLVNNKLLMMSLIIFTLILLVTYFVRRMKFDYAFEISIVAGALTSILGFLISDLIFSQSGQIFSMILGTIVSAAIVYGIHFFKLTLDYSGVEHVQFEDDAYYYYVKAVPKITVTAPQVNVKHINVKSVSQGFSRSTRQEGDVKDHEYDEDDDITLEDVTYPYHEEKYDFERKDSKNGRNNR